MGARVIVVLLALLVCCFAVESDRDLYHNFLVKYKKSYYQVGNREEYDRRFEIFKSNLRVIEKENAKNSGFNLGITPFADLTNEEFRSTRMNQKGKVVSSTIPKIGGVDYQALPASFNWINHNVVGPVVNLGDCGSSYVYTVVESISSIYAISQNATYTPVGLDQVPSCLQNGCDGGDSSDVLNYV